MLMLGLKKKKKKTKQNKNPPEVYRTKGKQTWQPLEHGASGTKGGRETCLLMFV